MHRASGTVASFGTELNGDSVKHVDDALSLARVIRGRGRRDVHPRVKRPHFTSQMVVENPRRSPKTAAVNLKTEKAVRDVR